MQTTVTTLTEAEAIAILADEEAERLPYRVINAAGQAAVLAFIQRAASEPEKHNPGAWFSDAERAANDAGPGESIIIEMRGMHTASRNPDTLTLERECFDWVLSA